MKTTALSISLLAIGLAACGGQPSSGGPSPSAPADYLALPDTLVCVLDRSAPRGLANISAKKDGDDVVIFDAGQVRTLEDLHPVNLIAGYAGNETWLQRGEVIGLGGQNYSVIGGERRVGIDLLDRVGEHRGILLFAGLEDDDPYDAVYVPTAPGCIFQPFVREDLIRR